MLLAVFLLIVFIVCRSSVTHTIDNVLYYLCAHYAFHWWWIPCRLEMEPPDVERVLVGSRDHSLVSSLKESVSRRNLIFCALSARPGIDILFFFFFSEVDEL